MNLVDWHNILHRGIHPNKAKVIENPDYLSHVTLTMILNLSTRFGASRKNPLVLCCDSKPTWRHSFYSENCAEFPEYAAKDGNGFQTYKGDRIKDETIPWDRINEINDDIIDCLNKNSDFNVMKVDQCEADDIIAVLAKQCSENNEPCNIISTDGDFVQCQDEWVNIFNPIKNIFVPKVDIEEYKKLHFIVAGDDNIKNIKRGLGKITALKLLPRLDEELSINPEMKKRYEFNKTLIDFERIPDYIRVSILEEYERTAGKYNYNAMNLIKLFRKYSLNAIGERVMSFKLSEQAKETALNTHYKKANELSEWQENTLEAFFE